MIFLSANKFLASESTQSYEIHSFKFYWMGFLYVPGYKAGRESIKALFHKSNERQTWGNSTSECMGNFVLVIYDKNTNTYFITTDPSGMFQCYYSSEAFSTHFLELIRHHNLSADDIAADACLDFIQLGYIYFGRTFFSEIKKLPPEKVLHCSQARGMSISNRPVDKLSSSSGIDLHRWQSRLGQAMEDTSINMDLTGGSDTRFILATLIKAGIKPDTSTYGYDEEIDVLTAKNIAELLNIRHFQQVPSISDPNPLFYFLLVDGLADISKYLGFYQVVTAKQKAGYQLSINGGGGGICKDFLWQQDFPFYNNRQPNWKRLLNTRIYQKHFPESQFGDRLRPHSDNWIEYWMDNLSQYNDRTNTASYDNVFFEILMRERVGHSNAMESRLIASYSPILEHRFASWSYNQSRIGRWLNLIQRKAVTDSNIELANLATNHALLNLSSQKHRLPMEITKKLNEYIKKGIKLPKRGKHSVTSNTHQTNNQWISYMDRKELGNSAFRKLQKEGFISNLIETNSIPAYYAGRVITLGLLLEYIDKPFKAEAPTLK